MSVKNFFRIVFVPDSPVASVPLVFFSLTIAIALQFPASLLVRSGFVSIGVIANEVVAMLFLPAALIFFLRLDRGALLPFRRFSIASLFMVIVLTIGADIIIDYLTSASEIFFPLPADVKSTYDKVMTADRAPQIAWKFFILCGLPAFCEEIFFRGFCQTSLAAKWGKRTALVAVAFMFAAMHGNPWHIHLYFLLGLLLGFIFSATGVLWAPIVCHLVNNTWTFFFHLRGFHFDVGANFGWRDFCFITAGVLLVVIGIRFLSKKDVPAFKP